VRRAIQDHIYDSSDVLDAALSRILLLMMGFNPGLRNVVASANRRKLMPCLHFVIVASQMIWRAVISYESFKRNAPLSLICHAIGRCKT
jgi:hypothetical protein